MNPLSMPYNNSLGWELVFFIADIIVWIAAQLAELMGVELDD